MLLLRVSHAENMKYVIWRCQVAETRASLWQNSLGKFEESPSKIVTIQIKLTSETHKRQLVRPIGPRPGRGDKKKRGWAPSKDFFCLGSPVSNTAALSHRRINRRNLLRP